MLDSLLKLFHSLFEKPLKVAIIISKYPREGEAVAAGAFMHVYYLSRNLAELGCEVHVFSSNDKDQIIRESIGKGKLIVHYLNVNMGFEIKDPLISHKLKDHAFEVRVLNQIMYENSKRWFDIIHTQGWPATGFMLKHFNNMNWINTFHSLETKRLKKMTGKEARLAPIYGWVEDTVVDADRLIAVSNKAREEIIKNFKGVARKTVTINNGVDLELFKPSKENPVSVLYIGRFSKEKGIDILPEIIKDILKSNKNYKFIAIAAKSRLLPELQETYDELVELKQRYKDRFIWYDRKVLKEDVAKMYYNAGVYIQPSVYETFGMCVLEAMATGRAVVVTNVGGMPELVDDAGIIVEPNAKKITEKVLLLLKNRELREKYGKLAAERAKNYDWKKIAQQTLDLYHEVMNERKLREQKQFLDKKQDKYAE